MTAGRVYALVLCLLPARLREDYGDEMQHAFEERCRHAAARGRLPLAAAVTRELFDVAAAAVRARHHTGRQRRRRMHALTQDWRHAVRMLLRQRSFAAVAVLTLALGIGVTTAVFSVVNGVLLRPLPFADPDRVVLLLYGNSDGVSPWLSPLNYQDYVAQSGAFSSAAALTPATANLTGGGDPERVSGARVTPAFFDVLGATMSLGRGFLARDAEADARTVVISDGLWRRRFGADAGVVGSTITIDGEATTIVGVAPRGISYPANVEFWTPLVFTPRDVAPAARGAQFVLAFARLRSGLTVDQASSALGAIAGRFAVLYPATEQGSIARVVPLRDRIVRTIRPPLRQLLLAVSFVLAIACANVAGLLLARGAQRSREIGVRTALGAGRWRLARQFLTESLALGLLGVVTAIPIAFWLVTALLARAPAGLPRLDDVRLDGRVLGFAVAVGLLTSVVFGLVPAIFDSRGGSVAALAGTTRGASGGAGRRIRRILVAGEIALAVVLLAGGGLLLRSYDRLRQVNPGFDDRNVTTFQLSLPSQVYPDAARAGAFVTRLLAALRATSGIESAAAAMGVPFGLDLNAFTTFRIAGRADPGRSAQPPASLRLVSDDYFRVMTLPVRRGRAFDARDTAESPEVAVINERFADRYFAGQDPIGQQLLVSVSLSRGGRNGAKTIVGVVGNVRYGGLDEAPSAEIYVPYAQQSVGSMTIVVKSAVDPAALVPALRSVVASLDPLLPLANVKPLAELIDGSVAARRFAMLLVLLFAGVALALAAVGLYSVLAYLVATRASEVGVRLALGATGGNVVWLFLREGLWLTLAGLMVGLAAARASAGLLAGSLFGIAASDPATFASVAVILGTVALCAMAVPVWRATRVNPTSLLRTDA